MSADEGYTIVRIPRAGAEESGEHVQLSFDIEGEEGDEEITLFLPVGLYQGLMTALMGAGNLAYKKRVKALGSEEAVANFAGLSPFTPTDVEVSYVSLESGRTLMLRLKLNDVPMVDALLAPPIARKLSDALASGLVRLSEPPPKPQ